jgi:hypothetical protein
LEWVKPFLPRDIDEERLGVHEAFGEIKEGAWGFP